MILVPRRWAHTVPGEFSRMSSWSRGAESVDLAHVSAWEAAVAHYTGSLHAVAVNSGRQGMAACLRYFGVRPGDEVIIPAYTLAGLIPLITGLGAAAVPAEIDPETLNVTAATVAARITPRTRAILVLHTFGNPAPMADLAALATAKNIPLIEDCAHALGATLSERHVGTFGSAGFFSFEPTKPVNTYGGGMVVTNDATLAEAVRREEHAKPFDYLTLGKKLKTVRREQMMVRTGMARPLLHLLDWPPTHSLLSRLYRSAQSVPGGSFRYTPAQARLGLSKLEGLDKRLEERRSLAAMYAHVLGDHVHLQSVLAVAASTYYFLAARIPGGAAAMKRRLLRAGIDSAAGEEVADDCAHLLGVDDCPEAARAYEEVLALPFYEGMDEATMARVASVLRRGLEG